MTCSISSPLRAWIPSLLLVTSCGGLPATNTTLAAADPPSPCDNSACRIVARTPAGTDASGADLFVVEVSRGWRSLETEAPTTDPDEPSCELRQWWLERSGSFEIVLSVCNNGYGASGVGEDSVTIANNRLVHDQSGGSAWRWATLREHQLVPTRLLTTSVSGYFCLGTNTEERYFDFTHFRGRVRWYSPPCGSAEAESGEMGDAPEGPTRSHALLPTVELDPRFDPASNPVEACGTRIDATEATSFLLSGARGDADDAWLEIIATPAREVLVLVHDDSFVAGDRLTVRVGSSTPSYMEHCIEPTNDHASYVFDVAAGTVIEGDASVIAAGVGRAPGGHFVRFTMPESPLGGGLTIAYTDADERGVERTFATSDFREGDSFSLGSAPSPVEGPRASCAIRGNALVRVLREAPVVAQE